MKIQILTVLIFLLLLLNKLFFLQKMPRLSGWVNWEIFSLCTSWKNLQYLKSFLWARIELGIYQKGFHPRNGKGNLVGTTESCDARTRVSTAEMWWDSLGWLKVTGDFLALHPNAHTVASGVPLLQSILCLGQLLQQLSCPQECSQCPTDLFYLLPSFQMHALNSQRLLKITISKWGESKQRK